MRDFRRKPGQLRRLSFQSRLVYTLYLCSVIIGLIIASFLSDLGPGFEAEQASLYYAGGEVEVGERSEAGGVPGFGPSLSVSKNTPAKSDAKEKKGSGPVLDLGGLDDPLDMGTPKSSDLKTSPENALPTRSKPATILRPPINSRRLLETTHGHLFIMPLLFLVVAHLFALCGLRPLITATFIGTGALSIALHIATPWLIRDISTSWAIGMPLSGAGMLLALGGMSLLSILQMWRPLPPKTPKTQSLPQTDA